MVKNSTRKKYWRMFLLLSYSQVSGVNIGDKDKNISKDFASVLCVSISQGGFEVDDGEENYIKKVLEKPKQLVDELISYLKTLSAASEHNHYIYFKFIELFLMTAQGHRGHMPLLNSGFFLKGQWGRMLKFQPPIFLLVCM